MQGKKCHRLHSNPGLKKKKAFVAFARQLGLHINVGKIYMKACQIKIHKYTKYNHYCVITMY